MPDESVPIAGPSTPWKPNLTREQVDAHAYRIAQISDELRATAEPLVEAAAAATLHAERRAAQ